MEPGEPFEKCAARESLEETGLKITKLEFITATNDVMEAEKKHYVTIFMKGVIEGSTLQPQVCMSIEYCFFLTVSRSTRLTNYASRYLNRKSVRSGNGSHGRSSVLKRLIR